MAIKCVILDMDGLLVDTEKIHFQAYQKALSDFYVTITIDEYIHNWTNQGKGIKDYIEDNNLQLESDHVKSIKTKYFKEIASEIGVQLYPGVRNFLNYLRDIEILVALASSASLIEIKFILQFTEIESYFHTLVGKDDVLNAKPSPDLFLKAANRLGVDPDECIVIEDAEKGVRAAKDAGMKCIVVPNPYTKDKFVTAADFTESSLVNIDFKKYLNL